MSEKDSIVNIAGGRRHAGLRLPSSAMGCKSIARAYALPLETLRRVRGSETPHIRIDKLHIEDEGRAIIGAAFSSFRIDGLEARLLSEWSGNAQGR